MKHQKLFMHNLYLKQFIYIVNKQNISIFYLVNKPFTINNKNLEINLL